MNNPGQNYQQNQYRYQNQQNMNQNYQQNTNNPPKRNRKPIHTAFFSNISYDFPMEKFKEFAMSFGEVAHIYSLIPKKGFAFVTYNDIRNAEKAVENGNDRMLNNRPVKTNYADKSYFPHQDPRETCSTILVQSMSPSPKIKVHEVISVMINYGEIHNTTAVEGHPGAFIVKYYNIKDAKRAMENPTQQIGQEQCTLQFKIEDESNPDISKQQAQYRQQPMQGMYQQGYQQQQGQQYQRMPQQGQGPPQQMQQPPPPPPQYYQQPYYSQNQSNQPPPPPPPQYGAPPGPPSQQNQALRKLKELFNLKK